MHQIQMDAEVGSSKNSETIGASKVAAAAVAAGKGSSDGADCGDGKATVNGGHCLIDVEDGLRLDGGDCHKGEKVCRICHFGEEFASKEMELIQLGCDCKGELGSSHPHCAEVWFGQKGNRTCEICGKTAKNIEDVNVEEMSVFMIDWEEMRLAAASLHAARERSNRYSKQFICNVVLAFFVLAFLLMWFFRGINIF